MPNFGSVIVTGQEVPEGFSDAHRPKNNVDTSCTKRHVFEHAYAYAHADR